MFKILFVKDILDNVNICRGVLCKIWCNFNFYNFRCSICRNKLYNNYPSPKEAVY